MTREPRDAPQFYLTAPSACPYLPNRQERKVFTHLIGERAGRLNDVLSHGGFRRSQTIAYRPACESCKACVSVRVPVADFIRTKSFRRTLADNTDVASEMRTATPTSEQYSTFRAYLDQRHADGGMADMTVLDYAMMVEDTHVNTRLVEYRLTGQGLPVNRQGEGPLIGVSLTDILADGLSMVYSFYEPGMAERSVGTLMILYNIERTKALGLPYLYLGYWVDGSRKMAYKGRFLPQERLGPNGWDRVEK